MQKIIQYEEVVKVKEQYSTQASVLIGGCFDILHYGHLTFLKKAKAAGDFLIVALEPDEFIEKKKKRQPIHSQRERAEILVELRCVDLVVLLPYFTADEGYLQLVKNVRPAIIAVTERDSLFEKKQQHAEKVGAQIKIVTPPLEKFASSIILKYASFFGD